MIQQKNLALGKHLCGRSVDIDRGGVWEREPVPLASGILGPRRSRAALKEIHGQSN
jgi:hypothetical protein